MKSSCKRILMIGPFPNPISGVSLANQTVKDILVDSLDCSIDYINTSFPKFEEKVGEFSIGKFFFFFKMNFKAFKVLKSGKVYITPGQTFFGVVKYFLFIIVASILNKELIIHVHGNHLGNEYMLLKGFKKRLFKYLISRFTKGIVLSESLKSNLTPFLKENSIYVLPNFAEEYFYTEDVNLNLNPKELRIIFLSNLMKEKGILSLLSALSDIGDEGLAYKARIAGNIDENSKKEIQFLIEKNKNIEYMGVVEGMSKKNLLDWGNIFVLPTYYRMEGQPISILEAMATKNLIITTKHGGIPDIIRDEVHGFFVEKNSSDSIKKVLKYLDKDKSVIKNIAIKNKEYFMSNYTLEKFKEGILRIMMT